MPQIKIILLQVQVLDLLKSTIDDTVTELKNDLNESTIRKLIEARHALEIEIMMSHARMRVIKNPNHGEE